MQGYARYWIFFVIVAIGLVLSWGQVGRKTHQVLTDEPVIVLYAEPGCSPLRAPCAAMAGDRGLVLGPDGPGLRLEQAGFATDDLSGIDVEYLAADGEILGVASIEMTGSRWLLPSAVDGAVAVRVSLSGDSLRSVAEFPFGD